LPEQDRYESDGLDDEIEDVRDMDQLMADRAAAELVLDRLDGIEDDRTQTRRNRLPALLQG
jgi:DNA replication licensing factor MCM2